MKSRKGFTLIELLAVIVILGLLMAIAIPSVTKYITQSRKKTLTTTIGNYMSALTTEVNNMEYVLTATNTIYAVPVECIALERGGTNPFGKWYQANDSYWAYVLVQYDDINSSYTYGFTFKDSAGYGLYPISIEKLNENGKQINTGLDLTRPTNGTITNITPKNNWIGFDVEDDTNLVVLEAESEGNIGDGKYTCTLNQKGENYTEVEEEKLTRPQLLNKLIKMHNKVVTAIPTLTTSTLNSGDQIGLYMSSDTNSGSPTYYFRGNVQNNFVDFAGETWRIVRINEDGTIRLILTNSIEGVSFTTTYCDVKYMYYSNSDSTKVAINNWYSSNLSSYDSYISNSMFCEQAKVKSFESSQLGLANAVYYKNYKPNFKCSTDGNDKGILYLKVGLLSYDEAIFAGNYYGVSGNSYVLHGDNTLWSMSPSNYSDCLPKIWLLDIGSINGNNSGNIKPVINLNADVYALGSGTATDPYVVQIN